MPDLVAFYRGQLKNSSGHSLEDMWKWDEDRLERGHTYIQWMFPNDEASKKVPGSPVLTESVIAEFRGDVDLRKRLLKSFNVFVDFLGLHPEIIYQDNKRLRFEKNADFESKSSNWLNQGNHNHLRITRVIRSLKLLGCGKVADKFYESLMQIAEENPGKISETTKQFWKEAVELS